jgi:hypothetical protein
MSTYHGMRTDKLLALWRDISMHSDVRVRLPDGTVYEVAKIDVKLARDSAWPTSMIDLRPLKTAGKP